MSKKRKKNSVNPARAALRREQARQDWQELLGFMGVTAEQGLEECRKDLLGSGATEEQIDQLMRLHRCRMAYEALEAGDVEAWDRLMAPLGNEQEVRQMIDKGNELGIGRYLAEGEGA